MFNERVMYGSARMGYSKTTGGGGLGSQNMVCSTTIQFSPELLQNPCALACCVSRMQVEGAGEKARVL